MREGTVMVVGDVCLDCLSCLPANSFGDITSDAIISGDIELRVGGNGVHLALAARLYFSDVTLVASIGVDLAGDFAAGLLNSTGLTLRLQRLTNRPTGVVISLRDASTTRVHGVRLLIAQSGSANHGLSDQTVAELEPQLQSVDFLIVDGFAVVREPRRTAALRAMQIASTAGAKVIFDLVPHTAYSLYDLAALQYIASMTDVMISEVRTLRGFLGLSVSNEGVTRTMAEETLHQARRLLSPSVTLMLRFGAGNIQESLVCEPSREMMYEETGYTEAEELIGFGERLTLAQVARLFGADRYT